MTSKLQETALKREHPTLQKIKFINFCLFLWVIFAILDPDPGTLLNPDPQHCLRQMWRSTEIQRWTQVPTHWSRRKDIRGGGGCLHFIFQRKWSSSKDSVGGKVHWKDMSKARNVHFLIRKTGFYNLSCWNDLISSKYSIASLLWLLPARPRYTENKFTVSVLTFHRCVIGEKFLLPVSY